MEQTEPTEQNPNEEKAELYKGFLIMKFSKIDFKRPSSKIKMLKRKRLKLFESKVKIEISAIQRLLRDLEKFKSYHSIVPKKDQKNLKEYEGLRSELKKYLYELIQALGKKN